MSLEVNTIYTGIKFCRRKVLIESTGDKEVDAALKKIFHDKFHCTAPLTMARDDVQFVLAWMRGETGISVAEQRAGQGCLWERKAK